MEGVTSGPLLLCGVQELVLAAAPVAGPEAGVGPEVSDGVHVAPVQLCDLHRVHVLDPLGIHLRGQGTHTHRGSLSRTAVTRTGFAV